RRGTINIEAEQESYLPPLACGGDHINNRRWRRRWRRSNSGGETICGVHIATNPGPIGGYLSFRFGRAKLFRYARDKLPMNLQCSTFDLERRPVGKNRIVYAAWGQRTWQGQRRIKRRLNILGL